jgi:hypothetical protein
MARIPVDPNYSFPTFPRATAATDIFVKEDVQALAAAVSTHVHDGAGKGLLVGGPAAGSITNAMLGADVARANLLTNGGMAIAQRGNGPFTTNTAYTADRWQIALGGGSAISVSCASAGIGAGGGATVPCVQGSYTHSTASYLLQQVKFAGDGNHVGHLGGQTVSLSMRVWANAANAVRISLSTDGTGPLNAVSSFHPGNAAVATLTVTGLVPSDATVLNVELNFQATCSQWYAGQAMLVVGSQPANYVPLHPADDLARCKRYYELIGVAGDGLTMFSGIATAGSQTVYFNIPQVEKPVTPTVTVVGVWTGSLATAPPVSDGGNIRLIRMHVVSSGAGPFYVNNNPGTGIISSESNP